MSKRFKILAGAFGQGCPLLNNEQPKFSRMLIGLGVKC